MNEQNIVVERERFQLRKAYLDPLERPLQRAHGYRMDLLKKWSAALPVGHVEDDPGPTSPRDEEVAFAIANTLSRVDIQGSFRDHALAIENGFLSTTPMLSPEHVRTVRLDTSSVRRRDVPSYETSRYRREIAVIPFDPLSYVLRRLIVHEILLNDLFERWIECDGASLCAGVFPFGVRALMRIRGIV